jgi:Zn-dependent protease
VTNLAIAAVLFAGFLVMMPQASNFGGALVIVYLTRAAFVNAILAGFNMIPLMPLDGAKVWAWNKAIYVGVVAVALALIYVTLPRSF